jgi:hypothetical protein
MRLRTMAAVACGAIGLLALSASADAATLHDQADSPSSALNRGIFSLTDPTLDVQAADDFTVPARQSWLIQSVDVIGHYDAGAGPIASANVFLYSNSGSLPGVQLFAQRSVIPANGTAGPNFNLPVTSAPLLVAGTYWVSVQANFTTASDIWDWDTRTIQSGNPAVFRANSGFALCPGAIGAWITRSTCAQLAGDPDQLFRLNGTSFTLKKRCKKAKRKHRSAEAAKKRKCKKKRRTAVKPRS